MSPSDIPNHSCPSNPCPICFPGAFTIFPIAQIPAPPTMPEIAPTRPEGIGPTPLDLTPIPDPDPTTPSPAPDSAYLIRLKEMIAKQQTRVQSLESLEKDSGRGPTRRLGKYQPQLRAEYKLLSDLYKLAVLMDKIGLPGSEGEMARSAVVGSTAEEISSAETVIRLLIESGTLPSNAVLERDSVKSAVAKKALEANKIALQRAKDHPKATDRPKKSRRKPTLEPGEGDRDIHE